MSSWPEKIWFIFPSQLPPCAWWGRAEDIFYFTTSHPMTLASFWSRFAEFEAGGREEDRRGEDRGQGCWWWEGFGFGVSAGKREKILGAQPQNLFYPYQLCLGFQHLYWMARGVCRGHCAHHKGGGLMQKSRGLSSAA